MTEAAATNDQTAALRAEVARLEVLLAERAPERRYAQVIREMVRSASPST